MKKIIENLKHENQDFEFYPTTEKMLRPIVNDLLDHNLTTISFLDVGAGNGNVFKIIDDLAPYDKDGNKKINLKKYAIEKSQILIKMLPDDVFVIGTEFEEQTFIDKEVNVIFCNPPYKQYIRWMEKIIKEANAQHIYFIVPDRWKKEKVLLDAIKNRTRQKTAEYEILGSFGFDDSEFRKSRAHIDIIKISLQYDKYASRNNLFTDPFDTWFNEFFKINADVEKPQDYYENKNKRERIHNLATGQNIIEVLSEAYTTDLKHLIETYKKIETLDPVLLKELDVNINGLKEGLKSKISGLKNLYWLELFNNLDKLTSRLTSKSRQIMLEKLTSHTSIDFTANNAYAVIIWAIKNANQYMEKQLVEVYKDLTTQDSFKKYKSNNVIYSDNWRYARYNNGISHYSLDYRIVIEKRHCFNSESYRDYDYPNGLYKDCHAFLNDICTIGTNLGFALLNTSKSFTWESGVMNDFYFSKNGDKKEIFMSVRAYKNGNIHLKINQEFMRAFNIEAARINKWIKSPEQYAGETDENLEDIKKYYTTNMQFNLNNIKALTYV